MATAHALAGLALAPAIPGMFHRQMKIGIAYYHWHQEGRAGVSAVLIAA